MKKQVICLAAFAAALFSTSPASATLEYKHENWTFGIAPMFTVMYSYNSFDKKFDNLDDKNETYTGADIFSSAEYKFNDDYQLGIYLDFNTDGNQYLKDYRGYEWDEQLYGILTTPYGSFQYGQTYNVGYLFYTGAPSVGPLGVNDSGITNYLTNPDWSRSGRIAAYRTLNSTAMNTENVAAKINYISPAWKGTQFGFSYVPDTYSNEGLISKYTDYSNNDAYIFALSNQTKLGDFNVSSYLGYGIYMKNDLEYAAGLTVAYKNWTLGGSFHRTYVDGDDTPVNHYINSYYTPELFDNYREGKAWNIGLGYQYEDYHVALTYFESTADNSANKTELVQFSNQYQLNKYLKLYGVIAHANFIGSAGDSINKGYAYITGFRIQL